jgi:hypothetical protein
MSWKFVTNIFGGAEGRLWHFKLDINEPNIHISLPLPLGGFRAKKSDETAGLALHSIGVTDNARCAIILGRDRMLYIFGNEMAGCISPDIHVQLPELSYRALKKYIEDIPTSFYSNHRFGDSIAERYSNNSIKEITYNYYAEKNRLRTLGEVVVNKALPSKFAEMIGKYGGSKRKRYTKKQKN